MKFPTVTVLMPAYNEVRKIRKSIESVLNQNYERIELIVIDDGSSDGTDKIVEEFKDVKLLKQKNRGPGAAKNKGAKKAKGKILVFVDADEILDKNYVKNLVEPIRKGKAIATVGTYRLYKPKNPWVRCLYDNSNELIFHGGRRIFRAIKKEHFLRIKGFDPKKGYADDHIDDFKEIVQVNNALFYHDVDDRVIDVYKKGVWVGKSYQSNKKTYKTFLKISLFFFWLIACFFVLFYKTNLALAIFILPPFAYVLLGSLRKVVIYKDILLLFYFPLFLSLYNWGLIVGLTQFYKKKNF